MTGLLENIDESRQEKELYFELGQVLTRQKKFRKAIEFLLEAKHTEGTRPEAWKLDYYLGTVYTKLNKTEDAVQSFLDAALIARETKSQVYDHIRLLITGATADKSISCINAWMAARQEKQLPAEDYNALAAIIDYARSLNNKHVPELPGDTTPAAAEALLKEVYALIAQYNYKSALEKVEAALSKEPHNAEILFLKIRILVESQLDLKGAAALFNDTEFGYRREINEGQLMDRLNELVIKEPVNGNSIFFAAFLANLMNDDPVHIENWLDRATAPGLTNSNEFPLLGLYLLKAEVAEKNSDNLKAATQYFEAAKCFYWQSNNPEANKYFEKCMLLNPAFNEAFFYNADTLFILSTLNEPPYNDFTLLRKAFDSWNSAPEKTVIIPDDAWHYIVIARMHEVNMKFAEEDFYLELWRALLYAERVLVHQNNVSSNWVYTSRFYRILEMEQNSRIAVDAAAGLDSNYEPFKEERILVQLNTGDFSSAMVTLQLLKDTDAGTGNVYKAYHKSWEGYILYHNKETIPAAISLFDEVIAEVKTDIFSRQMKMLCYWMLHDTIEAQKEAGSILALKKIYNYVREDFAFSWASFIMGDTGAAISCLELFNKKGRYANTNTFSLCQFYLYAGQTPQADAAFDAFITWTSNKNPVLELRDSLVALSFQFKQQTEPAFGVDEFVERVAAWGERLNEKLALLNNSQVNAVEELKRKQRQFEYEENTIPFIALKAGLARLCHNNNNLKEAFQLYQSLLQYEHAFPEAAIALSSIAKEVYEQARTMINDGYYAKAIEVLQFFAVQGGDNAARENLLLSQAYFGNYNTRESLASIQAFVRTGGEEMHQKYWQLLAGEVYSGNISWQFAKFIEDNNGVLQDPGLAASADEFFWKPVINRRNKVTSIDPLLIEISSNSILPGDPVKDWKVITQLIPAFRQKIVDEFGVKLPSLLIRENTYLEPGHFRILLNEIPVTSGIVYPGKLLITAMGQNPDLQGIAGVPATDPLTGNKALWVEKTYRDLLIKSNHPYQEDHYRYIIDVLETVVQPSLSLFVDTAFSGDYLFNFINQNKGNESITATVKAIQADPLLFTQFSQLLKSLVAEKIPLNNKPVIVVAFINAIAVTVQINEIIQQTRLALKTDLPQKHLLPVKLPAGAETLVKNALVTKAGKTFLAISAADRQLLLDAVLTVAGSEAEQQKRVLVVEDTRLRIYVRKLLETGFNGLAVAAKEELT